MIQRVRGGLRRRGAPRLGHDRDEPGRLDRLRSSRVARARASRTRSTLKSKQGWAPFGVEMKIIDDEDKRAAVGRQDASAGSRCAAPPWSQSLFQGRGRRDPRRGRLLRHRRRRDHRPRRLHADHRPRQGRHQVGRRVDLLDRHREFRRRPSRRRRGRGDRHRASEMGRAAAAGRRAEGGQDADSAEDVLDFLKPKIAKWWMPDDVQLVDGDPAHRDRQDQQAEAARGRSRIIRLPTA